jgi:hypothetical protein
MRSNGAYICSRMKRLIALALVLSIIMQSVVHMSVSVYYYLNKEFISKKLCENRSKPGMHCNGKCYLSKQLKKAEEREKKETRMLKDVEEQVLSIEYLRESVYVPDFQLVGFARSYQDIAPSVYTIPAEIPPEQSA